MKKFLSLVFAFLLLLVSSVLAVDDAEILAKLDGYYKLNGDGDYFSGLNGPYGVVNATEAGGGPVWEDGIYNEGAVFDGSASVYLNFGDNYEFGSDDFSVAFWFNSSDVPNSAVSAVLDDRNGDVGFKVILYQDGASLKVRCLIDNGPTAKVADITDNDADDGHMVFYLCQRTGDNLFVYTDGNFGTNVTGVETLDIDNANELLLPTDDGSSDFTGTIDELMIVLGDSFTLDQIQYLYTHGDELYDDPLPDTLNITYNSPDNELHTNQDPVQFKFNVSTDTNANCSIYINGTVNDTDTGLSTGPQGFNITMTDGDWTWKVNCTNDADSEETDQRNLTVDLVDPIWTVNAANFFSTTNDSIVQKWYDSNLNLSLADNYIFGWNITITNGSGAVFFQNVTTNSTASQVNFNVDMNLSNWTLGEYTASLYAEDDHTAHNIPDYTHGPIGQGHEWITDTGVILQVTAPGSTIETEKLVDRYTFTASFNGDRESVIFLLRSSEPLYHRGELYPFPTFVTGKHWVDFNTEGLINFTVEAQDYAQGFYRYQVHLVRTPSQTWEFESLGGLNTVLETYTFTLNNTPRQVENLSYDERSTEWINLTWDVNDEVSFTEIVRNGTSIANTTEASYNDSSLLTGTYYNYTLFAYSNDNISNTTISAENNQEIRTSFDTAISIVVYDELTLQIIPNSTISFIGPDNQTITDADGNFTFESLAPGNYTMRHTASGYVSRDQFHEIENGTAVSDINLYLLNVSESNLVGMTVFDYGGRRLEDIQVNLQRWFSNKSSYELVEMTLTSANGQSNFFVQPLDAWYKLVFIKDNVIVYTSEGRRITSQDLSDGMFFTLDVSDNIFESFEHVIEDMLTSDITHDAASNSFTFTYADTNNLYEEVCLNVYTVYRGNLDLVNGSCSSSASATLVTAYEDTNQTLIARAELETNTENSPWILDVLEIINTATSGFQILGLFALLATIGIIVTLAMTGVFEASVVIVLGVVGLIISKIVFQIPITYGTLSMIAIVGVGASMLMAWRSGR